MKIAVLNECFLNEDHLNKLKSLGELVVFENTDSEEKAIERLKGIDIAITDMFIAPFNKKVLESTDQLKLIVLNTTGFELVDLDTANKKGIKVADLPGFSTESVAELVIGLMFAVARKIPFGDKRIRELNFEVDPGNSDHQQYRGTNLSKKTLGIIGLGLIGQKVAQLGLGLGMKVVAYNRTPKDIPNVELVSLENLLQNSDVISVNLALAPELENIISDKEISLMKSTAILINTASRKHVDMQALYQALKDKKIAGAGLDLISDYSKNNPIFELDNVVLTPHVGWFTEESLQNLADIVVANVEAFIKGEPQNLVN